jgi:hypothetical protein
MAACPIRRQVPQTLSGDGIPGVLFGPAERLPEKDGTPRSSWQNQKSCSLFGRPLNFKPTGEVH